MVDLLYLFDGSDRLGVSELLNIARSNAGSGDTMLKGKLSYFLVAC